MSCSVARTLEVVGDRWSLLIIRDAFYGLTRFEELQSELGIARNVLTVRLAKLVDRGVLTKVPYSDRPDRFEYRLTDKGRDLLPVVLTLMAWGDRWEAEASGPPVHLTHRTCGHRDVHAEVHCSACGEALRPRDLRTDPVPVAGARREPDLLTAAAGDERAS